MSSRLCYCKSCNMRRNTRKGMGMVKHNTKEMAAEIIKGFKTAFNDVSIVPAKKKKCAICSKTFRKVYELRVRARKRITKGYNPYVGQGMYEVFVGRKKRIFKHLANVCSKECETMLALAAG